MGVATSPHALLQSSIGPIIVNFRLESVDSTSILSYHDALFLAGQLFSTSICLSKKSLTTHISLTSMNP